MNARPQLVGLALVVLFASVASAQESFSVGGVRAEPGQKQSGFIEIAPLEDDHGTRIPLTVAHGKKPGPVLALIAGIHGSEFSPILALQRLSPLIDTGELSGTVVMVHIANLPAFQGRTIYYSPADWKNLNRSFPGNPAGTVTERVAFALTNDVIARADYVMDIHSGDANEKLRPSYSAYYAEAGGAEVIEKSKRMAVAFGLDTILMFKGGLDPERAIWCGSAAVARGIPSIDIESGELGRIEDRRIDPIVNGILSVMRDLDMVEGEPTPTTQPFFVRERASVSSEHDGIWHPEARVEAGEYITKGALLGVITDYFGTKLTEVRAPQNGMILILLGTPPVNDGETIAVIANVSSEAW